MISGEALRRAGVFRLSELFQYAGHARTATLDGFTAPASIGGFSPFQPAAWTIMVDGRPVDTGLWGSQNLNLLPVPLENVRSVEVVETPTLYEGAFSDGGILHIRTGTDHAFAASVAAQNETGDPGPFQEVEALRSPNVDSNGPDLSVTGSTQGYRHGLTGSAVQRLHHPTDAALHDRIAAAYYTPRLLGKALRISSTGAWLSGWRASGAERYEADFSATTTRDFTYLPALGRELPVRQEGFRLSGGAVLPLRTGTLVRLSAGFSGLRARSRGAALGLPLDWSSNRLRVNARVERRGSGHELTVGASGDVERAAAPLNGLPESMRGVARVFGQWKSDGHRPALTAGGMLTAARSGAGGKAYVRAGAGTDRHRASLHLAAVQVLPEERTDLAYWMGKGFAFGDTARTFFPAGSGGERYVSADAGWFWVSRPWTVEVRGFYRRFARAVYLDRTQVYRGGAFNVVERAYRAASGATGGASVSARSHPGRDVDVSIEYSLVRAVAGDALFRSTWRAVPAHSARATFSSPLLRGLDVRTDVWLWSRGYWADYANANADTAGRHSAVVPGHVRWDVALLKRLAGGRVQASAAFENLLNRPIRYHPIGAAFGLTLRARVAVVF